MESKDLIKKLETEENLKKHGVKIKYNEKTKEYAVQVKGVSDRRDLESLIFRILMNKRSN